MVQMTTNAKAIRLALAALCCVLVLSGASEAGVVVEHQGNTDPATEEWTWQTIVPGSTDVTTGPVTNDGGYDAYYTDRTVPSSSSTAAWTYLLTPAEATGATAHGWRLSTMLRVVGVDDAASGAVILGYSDDSVVWYLTFGSDDGGNAIVATLGAGGFTPYTCASGGYHLYEVVYSTATSKATVYVDGVPGITDWEGMQQGPSGLYGVAWGALPTADTGRGNWNMVRFEAVPEPSGLLAIATGVTGLFGILRRRRA